MASLDPAHVLRGHRSNVQSLAFQSEGKLYAGDSNGELRIWDLESCRTEYTARLHDANAGIMHIAYLPGSGVLASQGRDGCVKLWAAGLTGALDRAQPLCEIRTESFNFCRCAVWAPGGYEAAGAATQWPAGQQPEPGPSSGLRGVHVACAAHDPADVGIWVPKEAPAAAVTLRQGNGSEPKHGMCMALAFLPGPGSAAPSEAASGTLSADAPDPTAPGADSCRGDGSGDAGPSPGRRSSTSGLSGLSSAGSAAAADPRHILAGYEDGTVALWDLRMPAAPLGSVRVHGEPVMCLDARPGATVRARRTAARRDTQAPAAGEAAHDADGSSAECGRGGNTTVSYDLVSGSADDKVSCCVVRPGDARPVAVAHQLRLREPGTADVRIRGDGRLFACGCWDGRVRLYSLRKREPLAVLKYHRDQVTALAFSPQTNMIASASRDTTIALWNVYASAPDAAATAAFATSKG